MLFSLSTILFSKTTILSLHFLKFDVFAFSSSYSDHISLFKMQLFDFDLFMEPAQATQSLRFTGPHLIYTRHSKSIN